MWLKKLKKKFFSIIFFTIIFILINSFLLKVAAASTFSGTAGDLIREAIAKSDKYFEMNSETLLKQYNKYNGRSMPQDNTEEGYLGSSVYCLGNIQGGYRK